MKGIKSAINSIYSSKGVDIVKTNDKYNDVLFIPILQKSMTSVHLKTITSFYIPKSTSRLDEFKECIIKNALPFLEQHIVCEDEQSVKIVKSICPSCIVHVITGRPTFNDFIEIIQKDATEDTIFVLMNGDIVIDETILLLKDIDFKKNVVCLQRWEKDYKNNYISIATVPGSQDMWCWKTPLNVSNIGKYYMGIPGCDNRLAKELSEQGFNCINCPYELISYHVHKETSREYYITNEIISGDYLRVYPTRISYTNMLVNKSVTLKKYK